MYWRRLQFSVPGEPRGKGRPRFTRTGRAYTDEKTAAYENLVRLAFDQKYDTWEPTKNPVKVDIIARCAPPKSWSERKKGRAYKDEIRKVTKPDCDNIIKVMDGLNGVAWEDDSQIIDIRCRKHYWPVPELIVEIWVEEEDEDDKVD